MKLYFVLIVLFVFNSVFSQVGINTVIPLQPFHIDGNKDNPIIGKPSEVQESNDLVLDKNGNLGIGTISPISKLDVRGNSNLLGNLEVNGITSFNEEIKIGNVSGTKGAYLVSQGAGKSPTWYVPKPSEQGDMSNVKEYSFMMLDANGNSTVVNVDKLFEKYLSTLTIPSVEFYASSTGSQLLKLGYNKIDVFKSELPSSKNVSWSSTDKSISILEDGKYLCTMQVGVSMTRFYVNENPDVLNTDIIVGFTGRDPIGTSDPKNLWVGRGVFRITKSSAGYVRGFTYYSTLLDLKRGDKIYPIIYLDNGYADDKVTLQGIQTGEAGDGVLTNFNVTRY